VFAARPTLAAPSGFAAAGRADPRLVERTSARKVTDPATRIIGSNPRNTNRQVMWSPIHPAIAGPTSPGTTQADDRIANMRGRTLSS